MPQITLSQIDVDHLALIRTNVREFIRRMGASYGPKGGRLLDIAPQVHEGAEPYFPDTIEVETLDIDRNSGCTYIADLCRDNTSILPDGIFDFVVCTEVLEHTLNPFAAVREIARLLKGGGILFGSVPFNFRIHGPLPDCWRFTEHGLRALLVDFSILELNSLETPDRPLMPIHYTFAAQKNRNTR